MIRKSLFIALAPLILCLSFDEGPMALQPLARNEAAAELYRLLPANVVRYCRYSSSVMSNSTSFLVEAIKPHGILMLEYVESGDMYIDPYHIGIPEAVANYDDGKLSYVKVGFDPIKDKEFSLKEYQTFLKLALRACFGLPA